MSSSQPTSDTVIFSDDDVDGVMAAKVIHNMLRQRYPTSTHSVLYQKWDKFGLFDEDVEAILSHAPRTVYILDIGSDSTVLTQISKLLAKNINVYVFDNHPPDVEDDLALPTALSSLRTKFPFPPKEAYPYPFFFYDSSRETCTTGISYEYVRALGIPQEAMERWTIMGLRGDVAFKEKRGALLYNQLMAKHPYLEGLFMSTAMGDDYDKSILEFYTQLFHVPRRIIFDEAPPLCFKAVDEMSTITDWVKFYLDVNNAVTQQSWTNPVKEGVLPNLARVVDLYREWKTKFMRTYNNAGVTLSYSGFGVTILESDWNLGSALANVKSSRSKMPHFVINVIKRLKADVTKEDIFNGIGIYNYDVHISGRSSDESRLHVGKVLRATNPTIMYGGGLKQAGSARAVISGEGGDINTEVLLNELVRAANKTLNSNQGAI